MIGLSKKLANIDSIKHTIYADDVTIWCASGSEDKAQDALQEAIDTIELYLRPTGLRCSSTKSELLLYRKERGARPKGWKPVEESDSRLNTSDGAEIPRANNIRILGFFIESGGGNGTALKKDCRQD